jgi:hypothetical protein
MPPCAPAADAGVKPAKKTAVTAAAKMGFMIELLTLIRAPPTHSK